MSKSNLPTDIPVGFSLWLSKPTANGEPRWRGIREFVGPTMYPAIEQFLRSAFDAGREDIYPEHFKQGIGE